MVMMNSSRARLADRDDDGLELFVWTGNPIRCMAYRVERGVNGPPRVVLVREVGEAELLARRDVVMQAVREAEAQALSGWQGADDQAAQLREMMASELGEPFVSPLMSAVWSPEPEQPRGSKVRMAVVGLALMGFSAAVALFLLYVMGIYWWAGGLG